MTARKFFLSLLCLAPAPLAHGSQTRDLDTRHYLIHTDLDAKLTADLGERLDSMYDEYNQRLALFGARNASPKLEVYLFRSPQDYAALIAGRLENSAGAFLPSQNQLAAFLGDQGRDQLRRTLQHEAFHQFAYNAIGGDLPVWLNEGLAQYFEEGLWNGDGFLLGEVPPRRVRQLQADLKANRLLDFSTLLVLTNDQWSHRLAGNRADGVTQYNQSWAIVHFLVMACNDRGEFLYRNRLLDMLRLLHNGTPASAAQAAVFGSTLQQLREQFLAYAKNLQATPEATLIENQGVLADLLIDFDRVGRHFYDIPALRRFVNQGHYRLHYSRGDLAWDTEPDMNAYFCDLAGKSFAPSELYFAPRADAALPDLVCRCSNRLMLRTRFHAEADQTVDHELLIEPIRSSASISE